MIRRRTLTWEQRVAVGLLRDGYTLDDVRKIVKSPASRIVRILSHVYRCTHRGSLWRGRFVRVLYRAKGPGPRNVAVEDVLTRERTILPGRPLRRIK